MKHQSIFKVQWLVLLIALISSAYYFTIQTESKMEYQAKIQQLSNRSGERPMTTPTNPHTQLNQQPEDLAFIQELQDWAFKMQHINKRPSAVSVPGAVAMCMEEGHTCQTCNAFMAGTEFAHFHPHPDYSLHLGLPTEDAEVIIEKGWGEWHPLIKRGFLPPNIIMMYAPRNQEELEAAKVILGHSYDFAKGKLE